MKNRNLIIPVKNFCIQYLILLSVHGMRPKTTLEDIIKAETIKL